MAGTTARRYVPRALRTRTQAPRPQPPADNLPAEQASHPPVPTCDSDTSGRPAGPPGPILSRGIQHFKRLSDQYTVGFVVTGVIGTLAGLSIAWLSTAQATDLATQQQIQANISFVRTVALQGTDLKPFAALDLTGAQLSSLPLNCREKEEEPPPVGPYDPCVKGTRADFEEASLARANLSAARLRGATVFEADLNGADLTAADLTFASFYHSDLTGATLTGATLTRATLTGAVLRDADLSGAVLRSADLAGADLTNANLTNANLTDALLRGADLDCYGHALCNNP